MVGARPKRSSTTGPTSRPVVIAATNVAKPTTPTQWRASYPSTSESASQSLAAPSARVNESTISPIASVRGSSHADLVASASSASLLVRPVEGKRYDATCGRADGQRADDEVVDGQRHAERRRDGAESRRR